MAVKEVDFLIAPRNPEWRFSTKLSQVVPVALARFR